MRRLALSNVLTACVVAAIVWLVTQPDSRSLAKPPGEDGVPNERSVRIDRPDATTKTGRQSVKLSVYRVTGGPEGTHQYAPIPERPAPGGGTDFVISGTDLWVVEIGKRNYILGPRD